MDPESKNFDKPDETRPITRGEVAICHIAGGTVGRTTFQPGWRWSQDVKPIVGGDLCQQNHIGYCISGKMRVRMEDGSEFDFSAGDVGTIPAGHDAWVVGDEPYVGLDWAGMATYAKPQ
jgi:hypothetical protein